MPRLLEEWWFPSLIPERPIDLGLVEMGAIRGCNLARVVENQPCGLQDSANHTLLIGLCGSTTNRRRPL